MMRINTKGFRHNFHEFTLLTTHNLMHFVTVGIIGVVSLLLPLAPLHAQTQSAMNAQARAEFQRADADLNKTYQSVLAKLPAVETKQKLREAQRAWIVSRDAEAARAAKEADGGSMAPTLRYETMTRLTRERIKELEAMLKGAAPNKKGASMPEPSVSSAPTASPVPPKESEGEQTKSISEMPGPPGRVERDLNFAGQTMGVQMR
jgi:uncharacterized protein YecT (DUF1311 family)